MEEYFDTYDADNKPTGIVKKRAEVHHDGDWHRTVHIYVLNNQGEYLVHLRSPNKDQHPNQWDTRFGGHVTSGESYETTVLAELEQEIGLKVNLDQLLPIGIFSHDGGVNREHVNVYKYIFNGDLSELNFSDNEVVKVRWMFADQIIDELEKNPDNWTGKLTGFKKINELMKK